MVGVLAVQGGFAAHIEILESMGTKAREVRTASDLGGVTALVFPGGESTTQAKLVEAGGLLPALDAMVRAGTPTLATCAGLILAVRYGWLDAEIERNSWGPQTRSFEGCADASSRPEYREMPLMLIRAPRILRVGANSEVLATFQDEPILLRQGAVVAATFHPELVGDRRLHQALR